MDLVFVSNIILKRKLVPEGISHPPQLNSLVFPLWFQFRIANPHCQQCRFVLMVHEKWWGKEGHIQGYLGVHLLFILVPFLNAWLVELSLKTCTQTEQLSEICPISCNSEAHGYWIINIEEYVCFWISFCIQWKRIFLERMIWFLKCLNACQCGHQQTETKIYDTHESRNLWPSHIMIKVIKTTFVYIVLKHSMFPWFLLILRVWIA